MQSAKENRGTELMVLAARFAAAAGDQRPSVQFSPAGAADRELLGHGSAEGKTSSALANCRPGLQHKQQKHGDVAALAAQLRKATNGFATFVTSNCTNGGVTFFPQNRSNWAM